MELQKRRELENRIGYTFKNPDLLTVALTHSSYSNEHRGAGESYERLEFFGDSILGFITAGFLYDNRTTREGELTRMRASLVCEQSLYGVANALNLGDFILFGRGEAGSGGSKRRSVLADVVEAILAAIYIDGGLEPASVFVKKFVLPADNIAGAGSGGDYKTELQELVQRDRNAELVYRIIDESGPDHNKNFTAEAVVNGVAAGIGSGKTKKEAEQAAARVALERLQ